MTILERIKLNSAKHPERVVMRTQYGFGEMTMKWGELDAFSDKLAYYLTKELRTNKPIIVYGHKHPMMLVCFLACVKSGRAYCPIDVNVPLSRRCVLYYFYIRQHRNAQGSTDNKRLSG